LPPPEVLADAKETGCAFVALRDGQVIGFVRAVSDYEVVSYVCELAVLPDARLKGVGRALLDMVAAEYPEARVDVLSTADAEGFYEAVGFVTRPAFRRWPA
jgi:predicted N-acetyltransferase YhbS